MRNFVEAWGALLCVAFFSGERLFIWLAIIAAAAAAILQIVTWFTHQRNRIDPRGDIR